MSDTTDYLLAQLNSEYAKFRTDTSVDFDDRSNHALAALWQLTIALAASTLPRKKPTRPLPPDARAALDQAKVGRVMAIPEAPDGPLYPEADLSDPFVCDQCKHSLPRHMIGGGCADCEKLEPEHVRCTWAGIR